MRRSCGCSHTGARRPRSSSSVVPLRARRSIGLAALFLVALVAFGCFGRRPDPDAEPGRARPLGLGRVHADRLDCRRGDCADWYRFEVDSESNLEAQLVTGTGRARGERRLALSDHQGRKLREETARTRLRTVVRWRIAPGSYFLSVSADGAERFPYELLARIEPAAPVSATPPAAPAAPAPRPTPRHEWVEMRLHEINGKLGEPQEVLFYSDRPLERGYRGRLVRGSQTVADVTVLAYYARSGGAKARIEGALSEPISKADTRLEIAVPIPAKARTTPRPSAVEIEPAPRDVSGDPLPVDAASASADRVDRDAGGVPH